MHIFWEDYDSDLAWTPRQMVAAEKARDDLEGVAKTPMEKTSFPSFSRIEAIRF
jgi:hypothetical protein